MLLTIAIAFSLLLCWFAVRANARFANEKRLPMQWWLNGEVTWYAPRHVALTFIPALANCVLAFYIVLTFTSKPRPGDEHLVLPILILLGATFVAVQLLHLFLVERTLRRNGS